MSVLLSGGLYLLKNTHIIGHLILIIKKSFAAPFKLEQNY
jgi:hypothetical protein